MLPARRCRIRDDRNMKTIFFLTFLLGGLQIADAGTTENFQDNFPATTSYEETSQASADSNPGESSKPGKSNNEEDGKTLPSLKTRGKLIQDASTGHWTLKMEEMEKYLDRHGRNARTLSMAFVMTGNPQYLDEATVADPGSPAGFAMKALNYPGKFNANDLARLKVSLGDNSAYAQLIGLFVSIQNKNVSDAHFAEPIDWSKIKEDPISRLGDEEIKILRELGGFSLGEAIVNARKANSLGSGRAIDTVTGIYHERAKSAFKNNDPEMAAHLLKEGVLLIQQRDTGWLMTGILAGVSSKGVLTETAKEYGLTSVFDAPFEKVLDQVKTDESHLMAMINTLDKLVPAFDSGKLLNAYERTEGRGQLHLTRALMKLEDVGSFFGNRLREIQDLPRYKY